jgi:hypothetical protein
LTLPPLLAVNPENRNADAYQMPHATAQLLKKFQDSFYIQKLKIYSSLQVTFLATFQKVENNLSGK